MRRARPLHLLPRQGRGGRAPPGTINDQLQLGDDLVREGYRLSCQLSPTEPLVVQLAPPLDESAFQILGVERDAIARARVALDAGIRKKVVRVDLPQEEHHQTSDLEQLGMAAGIAPTDVPLEVVRTLPSTLREGKGEVTVVTFQGRPARRRARGHHRDGVRDRDRRRDDERGHHTA